MRISTNEISRSKEGGPNLSDENYLSPGLLKVVYAVWVVIFSALLLTAAPLASQLPFY